MVTVSDILNLLDRIPIWKNLQALPGRVSELESRLARLEAAIAARPKADSCPLCGSDLKTTGVTRDPIFGDLGVQQHTLSCTNPQCAHSEARQVDPAKRR